MLTVRLYGAYTPRRDYSAYELVGKNIKFLPSYQLQKDVNNREKDKVTGVIRWVHPQGRFVLVEFQPLRCSVKLTECLHLPDALQMIVGG